MGWLSAWIAFFTSGARDAMPATGVRQGPLVVACIVVHRAFLLSPCIRQGMFRLVDPRPNVFRTLFLQQRYSWGQSIQPSEIVTCLPTRATGSVSLLTQSLNLNTSDG